MNFEFDNIIDWLEYVIQTEIVIPADEEYPGSFIELKIKGMVELDSDELLTKMHHKIKGLNVENAIWEETLWNYTRQIPDDICFYLIENDIARTTLGHTRQSDKVLWVLGHLVPEAALTLGKDIYLSDNYSLEDLKKLLKEYYDLHWLWQSLAYHTPSQSSKEAYFRSQLDKRPDFADIQEIMVESETIDFLKDTDSIEVIKKYFGEGTPRSLNSISSNPNTPLELLEKLTSIKNIDFAKSIRNQSQENIFKRTRKRFKP